MNTTQRQKGSLIGPIILIAAGLFFLLSNMGLIPWNFWEVAARLWPIVLIALGLDLLIGHRSPAGSLLVLLVTMALLAGGLFWLGIEDNGRSLVTDSVSHPLNEATSAEVGISFGVGDLHLSALPTESLLLVEGTLDRDDGRERIEQSLDIRNGVAHYQIATQGEPVNFPFLGRAARRTWNLAFNRDLPLQLNIRTGVGQANLDLRQLNITHLNIETGVGQTTVTLPGHGELTGTIQGGVGELVIEIPEGMAARIDLRTGLGSSEVTGDFQQEGNIYTSPGYATAVDRLDLELRAGVGQVTVRSYSGR